MSYSLYIVHLYVTVGVPFPSELEPETAQGKSETASPVIKTEVSVDLVTAC